MKKITSISLVLIFIFLFAFPITAVDNNESFLVSEYNFNTKKENTKTLGQTKNALNDNLITANESSDTINNFSSLSCTNRSDYAYVDCEIGDFIVENDQRTVVNNTTINPYSSIVFIRVCWEDGTKSRATGFLVSDDVVVTAAHVIYNPSKGGWPDWVKVYPGKKGDGLLDNPYGHTRSWKGGVCSVWREDCDKLSTATDLEKIAIEARMRENDWGALKLILPLGKTAGKIQMKIPTDYELNQATVKISGYPSTINNTTVYQQYETSGVVLNYNSNVILHDLDISKGQSGSPLLDANNFAIGVVTSANVNTSTNTYNYGSVVRFNDTILGYLNDVIAE